MRVLLGVIEVGASQHQQEHHTHDQAHGQRMQLLLHHAPSE
jgi:hypothetical protein